MLFSKRKKAIANPPSTHRYELPSEFRNQVIHIWTQSIGYSEAPFVKQPASYYDEELRAIQQIHHVYSRICRELCEEYGVLSLPKSDQATGPCQALRLFLQGAQTDQALDAIELSFQLIPSLQQTLRSNGLVRILIDAQEAIEKLNARFREHAIGFRFEQGRIVRLDSEFLHSEATEPALKLMHSGGFEGALAEFQLAHKQYRDGQTYYDDSLTNCLKSLESTLKTICNRRSWTYGSGDTVSKLLDLVFARELIPGYLQSHFTALRATLESGVPTIRNREGGHGSGEKPNEVPEYLAAYQLHLTASAIVFLIRANETFGTRRS